MFSDQVVAEPSNWPHPRGGISGQAVTQAQLADQYEPAWTYTTGGAVLSSTIVVDGVVYVGSEDKHLHAIDLETGKLKWKFAAQSLIDASPVYADGVVYIGTDGGVLHAVDAQAGTERWQFKTHGRISGEANVLSIQDAQGTAQPHVVVGSHDGNLYCIDAKTGQQTWAYETGDYINCGITLDPATGTIVLGGCDAKLHLIDKDTGKGLATVELGGEVAGTPAIANGLAYVGHMQGDLVAVDLQTHKVAWRFHDRDFPFFGSPAVLDKDALIIGSRGRRLYCLNPITGEKKWDLRTQGGVEGSPILNKQRAAFGSAGGRLSIIELTDGSTVWQHDLGAAIDVTPTPLANMLIVGCEDGKVYAFKASDKPDTNQ